MPSTYSASLRLTLQAPGEGLNSWGTILNNGVFSLVDTSISGWLTKALTGDYALTTANGASDEGRTAMLKFTGAGPFTVTIPSVSKRYDIWNACTGTVTITTGAGDTVAVYSGEKVSVICDGSNVELVQPSDMRSQRLTNVGAPTSSLDAATKKYVDDTAFSAAGGTLPGQTGNAGKLLKTDGATAGWGIAEGTQDATSGELRLLASDQSTVLGGMKSDTSGNVKLVNSSGVDRLISAADGSVTAKSDAGASNVLATQAFAVAMALAI